MGVTGNSPAKRPPNISRAKYAPTLLILNLTLRVIIVTIIQSVILVVGFVNLRNFYLRGANFASAEYVGGNKLPSGFIVRRAIIVEVSNVME
jgi:hypothetical protein